MVRGEQDVSSSTHHDGNRFSPAGRCSVGRGIYRAAMLRPIDSAPELAYAVPFLLDRSEAPRFRLTNIGAETVRAVSLTVLGSGLLLSNVPHRLASGQTLEFTVQGEHLARSTVVIVRWFRPSGEQYLWRVSF